MNSESPTLYIELIRRGLPADYARRTAEELDDHRADLLAGLRAQAAEDPEAVASERLGETRQLAKQIASDYRRRSWFGRWPLISFLLAPAPVPLVGWIGVLASVFVVGEVFELIYQRAPGPMSPAEVALARVLVITTATVLFYAVPMLVAWQHGSLALRATQSRAYLIAVCVAIGLANGLVYHEWTIVPEGDATHGTFSVGVPLSEPRELLRHYTGPAAFSRLVAPALVGGVLLWREARRRSRLLALPEESVVPAAA